jgi:putative ATP-binding cassette transporter
MTSFLKNLWSLIAPYWRSKERKVAILLLVTIIVLNLLEVFINVRLNKWNNDFYNALQALNKPAFFSALWEFSYLAVSFIIIVVYKIYLNQMLQLRWRRWSTLDFLNRWLDRKNYYRMQFVDHKSDNPDQRISEDVGQFIDLTLGLSLGLLSSIVTLFSFLFILWNLSGALIVPLGQFGQFSVPGYMVWVALLYAAAGTWITSKLGRPLIALSFQQQKFEADFRFALVRFRENSEPIAFYKGEHQEKEIFMSRFTRIFDNYWSIMKRQKTLTWFTSGYGQIANIFPILVIAPRYFAKQIQLGGLMQTASAFGQVQESFSFIISSYGNIATWKAVIQRLNGFNQAMQESETLPEISYGEGNGLSTDNLSVSLPNGEKLFDRLSLNLKAGDWLLIKGPSGSGKTTLLRSLAGLWPFTSGDLSLPLPEKSLFLPQKPYLPLGSLRAVLSYPTAHSENDETLRRILETCQLAQLGDRLDEVADWSHILSPGEQQRLAFARVFIAQPEFIFLDEASSALDEKTESLLYGLLKEKLPQAIIVSVGHRETISQFHDTTIDLSAYSKLAKASPTA